MAIFIYFREAFFIFIQIKICSQPPIPRERVRAARGSKFQSQDVLKIGAFCALKAFLYFGRQQQKRWWLWCSV
jgi:hypothetical protein